jgi:hypothetical protein
VRTDEMEALARESFSAYNERDASAERARVFSTADAEVYAVTLGRSFSLTDGYGSVFEDIDEVWEENQVEFVSAERLDRRLMAKATVRGRVRAGDLEIEQPYWYVFDFATPPDVGALRISRLQIFGERDAAASAMAEGQFRTSQEDLARE